MEHKGDGDTNCEKYARNNPLKFSKYTKTLRNQMVGLLGFMAYQPL